MKIFEDYKVKPSKQRILGWNTNPSSDLEELSRVVEPNEILTLFNLDVNACYSKYEIDIPLIVLPIIFQLKSMLHIALKKNSIHNMELIT